MALSKTVFIDRTNRQTAMAAFDGAAAEMRRDRVCLFSTPIDILSFSSYFSVVEVWTINSTTSFEIFVHPSSRLKGGNDNDDDGVNLNDSLSLYLSLSLAKCLHLPRRDSIILYRTRSTPVQKGRLPPRDPSSSSHHPHRRRQLLAHPRRPNTTISRRRHPRQSPTSRSYLSSDGHRRRGSHETDA